MKITKRQLQSKKVKDFNDNVRSSLAATLISEGLVPVRDQKLLAEFKLADLASKGAEAFSNVDTKGLEKAVVANAKKAGKLAQIGLKGLTAFMKPIAAQAISVAKDLGIWSIKNVGPAMLGATKFLGQSIKGLYGGIADTIAGFKDAKQFKILASQKPDDFRKMHSDYAEKFKQIGMPVRTAKEAVAYIGLSASDDGFEILKQAAQKAGVGIDVLVGQLNIFGYLAQYLPIAEKALAKSSAGKNESVSRGKAISMKITKDQLRQMIREALSFTDAETKHMADAYIKRFIDKPQMPKQGDKDYKEKLEALLADPAVLAKAIKFTPGKNMEDKKDAIIKALGSQFNQDFYHINKAAVEVIKRYGES